MNPVDTDMLATTPSPERACPRSPRAPPRAPSTSPIAIPGHVAAVAAMVLPHDLAVTTTQIPRGAIITASTPGLSHVKVTWVGRDTAMGFSIVRLGRDDPRAHASRHCPRATSVVAVAPIVKRFDRRRRSYEWANTTLGDPTIDATGVVSYLATQVRREPRQLHRRHRRRPKRTGRRGPLGQSPVVLGPVRRAHRQHRRDGRRMSREPGHRGRDRPGRRRDGHASVDSGKSPAQRRSEAGDVITGARTGKRHRTWDAARSRRST